MIYAKGDKIGLYTVVFSHKRGSYAETYRVKDAAGKKRFLKLINCSRLDRSQVDDDGRVIEVEISKRLNHRNLCRFIDQGKLLVKGKQYVYFVTEYVSGETLSDRIVRGDELSVYDIKQIVKAILSALSFLHSQSVPIIHNEVTIQNVMLNLAGDFGDLKLIDFGHARFLDQSLAKPNLSELNAFYLAPERFSGVCSVQSDLYSVGVLMYRLLYGKLPWFVDVSRINNDDKVEAILSERDKELTIPKLNMFELDEQVENCVIKALSYDVEDRFQSASDFRKAIDGELKLPRQSTRKKASSIPSQKVSKQPEATKRSGKGFSAVAGMEELKAQMREEIIEPLNNPQEYRRYGVTIPNGMLLYGPPGCGKTFFAKHFAEEVGFNFLCMTPATLKSKWVNATQENIANMFKEAEEKAPTIIFIDEFNELVPDRQSDVHEMSRSAVNEMLAQMDRTGERGVFVIGATNYPDKIDPAIMRAGRLDKKYYIGVPDREARKAIFELYLRNRPRELGINYDELSSLTVNYVSADIQLIVNNAARKALKLHSNITMALLKETISGTQPSLSPEEIKRYERIRDKMQGKPVRGGDSSRHAGFK